MKLLFLIPVTAEYERKKNEIKTYLQRYLNPDTVVEFAQISEGFRSIESDLQGVYNGWQTVNVIKELGRSYDGVYINCFDDPGVSPCRELGIVPVIGPYQAAIHSALVIADKIGIITTDTAGIIHEERKAKQIGMRENIASIIPVDLEVDDIREKSELLIDRLIPVCRRMSEEQGIKAICLGCTGMFYIADILNEKLKQEQINVTVIEPMVNAMKFLETMVMLKYDNSVSVNPDIRSAEISCIKR
ncbi:aspartate/glutamate racemase family protein [Ihubacter sp. mB4P-1]|uniref:aspartate/glutamate racemase family protein n=2 Tax=unclassified Ihubacter TaxID=2633299 RepID=UPI003C7CCD10